MSEEINQKNHFWPSYVDLMTSLFIIMLVLFVLSYLDFRQVNQKLLANARQMERIRQIDKSLKQLDRKYFRFDPINSRYKLLIDVSFAPNKADITTLGDSSLKQLKSAGDTLYQKMQKLSADKDINYLLIVEGNSEIVRYHGALNSESDPDRGYNLSYQRALALKKYWKDSGDDFSVFSNCEMLIVGSGYFGKSRDKINNKRFTIQITPKFKVN